MIQYDGKKWIAFLPQMFIMFRKSYNLKKLSAALVITFFYSLSLTAFHIYDTLFFIDTFYVSLLGFILSFFLVFRVNSSYNKWWEGRKQLGKLVNDCRTLALFLNALIDKKDSKKRKFFADHISNFCRALSSHLREKSNVSELISLNKQEHSKLVSALHKPLIICTFIIDEIENLFKNKKIGEIDKRNLKVVTQGFIDVLGACERIQKTPIPFSHNSFIKLFIVIYIIVLPFGLINIFGYLTALAVVLMSYALVGIEVISEEIEDPFGLEANDLPTEHIASVISKNMYEILDTDGSFGEIKTFGVSKINNITILH